MTRLIPLALTILILVLTAAVGSQGRVSADEAQAMWTVRDVAAPDATFTSALRTDLREFVDRIQAQPQPPLYFAALDAWTTLFGHQIETARVLSVLIVAIGVILVGIAARVDGISSWLAMLFAAALAIYAGTQAYVFAAVMATSALSWLGLRLFVKRPHLLRGSFYTLTAFGLLISAHVAPPLTLLHAWVAYREGRLRAWLIAFVPAVLIFMPWLLLFQSRKLDDFTPLTVVISWLMVFVPPLAIYGAQWWEGESASPRRYAVPAAAMTAAAFALLWVGVINAGEPDAVREIRALRADTEPALTYFTERDPLSYYNTQPATQINGGVALDLAWRAQSPGTLAAAVNAVAGSGSVWVMMPDDLPLTEQTTALLSDTHSVSTKLDENGMHFARYDLLE